MSREVLEIGGIVAGFSGYAALVAGLALISIALALMVGGGLLLVFGLALVRAVNKGTP